jgi:hypothetical protein
MNSTPFDTAYTFTTNSEYLRNLDKKISSFSPICIFCSADRSIGVSNDGGSLRRCIKCNKYFKATINFIEKPPTTTPQPPTITNSHKSS